tara:strand:+ start:945 stop:1193 length:249 start_codon:yes stop_codon:yes gene_type:complete
VIRFFYSEVTAPCHPLSARSGGVIGLTVEMMGEMHDEKKIRNTKRPSARGLNYSKLPLSLRQKQRNTQQSTLLQGRAESLCW